MKFLCVPCDQAMKFSRSDGPKEGCVTAVFQCPQCQKETALLLNPWETQLVSSLDVKIGGKSVSLQEKPLEMAQTYLQESGEETVASSDAGAFAQMFSKGGESKGKCPFSDVVDKMMAGQTAPSVIQWTLGASRRLENIPDFVRPMAKVGIEKFAQEQGHSEVTESVMDAAKEKFGM